jgi:hypothetical protein
MNYAKPKPGQVWLNKTYDEYLLVVKQHEIKTIDDCCKGVYQCIQWHGDDENIFELDWYFFHGENYKRIL